MKNKIISLAAVLLCLIMAFGVLAACGDEGDKPIYFVTFDYNYEGAPEGETQNIEEGSTVSAPSQTPTREGYLFDGWHSDAACTQDYSFDTPVTADLTIYAGWKEDDSYVSITFDLSSVDEENVVVRVEKGALVTEDQLPEIVVGGWECLGWYKEAALQNRWLWGLAVNDSMTLYGEWAKQYTFEAEYCAEIRTMKGAGFSGATSGLNMIEKDTENKGASNGFYVTYLYQKDLGLQFIIDSEEDVSGARMLLRLSTQYMNLALTSELFEVRVTYEDGTSTTFSYPTIEIDSIGEGSSSKKADFKDYLITESLSLKKGQNTISLTVINSGITMGTMTAYAPIIDCLKITTDGNLTWTENCDETNIAGK